MTLAVVPLLFGAAEHVQPARPGAEPPLVESRLALIKAGAVHSLPSHTEWPEDRFDDEGDRRAPIVITVVGQEPHGFVRYLEQVTAGKRAHGRPIIVRQLQYPRPQRDDDEPAAEDIERFREQLREAHILYIGVSERIEQRHQRILEWTKGRSILTVSTINSFAERGGMLRLTVRQNHLAMDANADLIREANLRVSSRLMRLARIVRSPDRNLLEQTGD